MPGKVRDNGRSSDGDADSTHFGRQAFQLAHSLSKWARSDGVSTQLVSVTLYPPSSKRGGRWLVVGKGFLDGVPVAAFQQSPDPLTALLGFFQQAFAGSLVWRRDKFAMTEAEKIVRAWE